MLTCKKLGRVFCGLLIGAAMLSHAVPTDPQAMLAASDAVRNPGQAFRVTVTLTEFEKGQQVDTSTLLSYSRPPEGSAPLASLIRFVQPLRDAGKLLLKSGSELWFYDPGTKASVRISPQQRLLGQAANGDVVTVNFARDYSAQRVRDETIQDGERHDRPTVLLRLTGVAADATYPSVELWLDADKLCPIRARFYSDSGRLLKTAYYRRFQRQLGADRPTETVIIDGLNPQSVTVVRLSDYQARPLPAGWFQRDFLPNFQPE